MAHAQFGHNSATVSIFVRQVDIIIVDNISVIEPTNSHVFLDTWMFLNTLLGIARGGVIKELVVCDFEKKILVSM